MAGCASVPAPVSGPGWPPPAQDAVHAEVLSIVDGDTIVLSGIQVGTPVGRGRTARLIGVDTPERGACYAAKATAFTRSQLDGRRVLAGLDVGATDRFGRALVYIWDRGVLFNARLLAEGYARQLTVPPNVRYGDLFTRIVRDARDGRRGLWGDACGRG